jgi:hypothetical protein
MANVQQASKVSLKEGSRVLTLGIQTERLVQNFSLSSTMFRHSLRLTIAICLSVMVLISKHLLILLTVIMRPSMA